MLGTAGALNKARTTVRPHPKENQSVAERPSPTLNRPFAARAEAGNQC
jgi:hypothetical protein